MVECQADVLPRDIALLAAVSAGAPLGFDGLPEASSGGIGRKIDEAEHIVIPVFGHHHGSSVVATLISADAAAGRADPKPS